MASKHAFQIPDHVLLRLQAARQKHRGTLEGSDAAIDGSGETRNVRDSRSADRRTGSERHRAVLAGWTLAGPYFFYIFVKEDGSEWLIRGPSCRRGPRDVRLTAREKAIRLGLDVETLEAEAVYPRTPPPKYVPGDPFPTHVRVR